MKDYRYPIRLTEIESKRFKEIEELGLKRSHYMRGAIKALCDIIDESERLGYTFKDEHDMLDMIKLVLHPAIIAVSTSYYRDYYNKVTAVVNKKIREERNNEIPFDYE